MIGGISTARFDATLYLTWTKPSARLSSKPLKNLPEFVTESPTSNVRRRHSSATSVSSRFVQGSRKQSTDVEDWPSGRLGGIGWSRQLPLELDFHDAADR